MWGQLFLEPSLLSFRVWISRKLEAGAWPWFPGVYSRHVGVDCKGFNVFVPTSPNTCSQYLLFYSPLIRYGVLGATKGKNFCLVSARKETVSYLLIYYQISESSRWKIALLLFEETRLLLDLSAVHVLVCTISRMVVVTVGEKQNLRCHLLNFPRVEML